jgi:hypothetical protein
VIRIKNSAMTEHIAARDAETPKEASVWAPVRAPTRTRSESEYRFRRIYKGLNLQVRPRKKRKVTYMRGNARPR